MPNIQTLTSIVQKLEGAYNWWNTAVLGLIGVTAFATILYFIASLMTISRANQLKNAQAALIRAKDDQLALDLKSKDVEIANANDKAAKANAEAAKANEGLGKSNLEIAKLTREAETLRSDAEKARGGIAVAQAEAAKANEKAESERLTRVKLEETLAPRMVGTTDKIRDELRLFAGIKVFILFVPDAEASNLALQMKFMLEAAGWNVVGMAPASRNLGEGAQILTRPMSRLRDETPRAAAELLSYQLRDIKINAIPQFTLMVWPENVPDDAIFIEIGMKPQPYFTDRLVEEILRQMDEPTRMKFEEMKRRKEEIEKKSLEYDLERRRRLLERQQQRLQGKPPN